MMVSPPTRRDFWLLHAVVLAWGLTAVLGKGLTLTAPVLVAWRTGLAAVGLWGWLRWQGIPLAVEARALARMLGVGLLIGLHWWLFFLAGKLGAVSTSLIGLSTTTLWCALLEPLFHKGKRLHGLEFWMGLGIVAGACVIGYGNPVAWPCLLTGVAAGLVGAVFSFFNNILVKTHDPLVITFYEMLAASVLMSLVSGLGPATRWVPQGAEWLWLLLLSQGCTVWAFSVYIGLLRRLSVFYISLAGNLEPMWGILLAGAMLGEYQQFTPSFWLGAVLVLASVIVYPILKRNAP